MINVAIIIQYFGRGGAEKMVSLLASNLDLSKVNVEVFCITGNALNNKLENVIREHGVKIHFLKKQDGFSVKAVIRLWKKLSDFHPNIVHTHIMAAVYSVPYVLLHRVRMIHTIHTIPGKELNENYRRILGFLFSIGKAIPIAISDSMKDLILETYKNTKNVEVIYNPVEIKQVKEPAIEYSDHVIITVGRFDKAKNHTLLLESFKKVVNIIPDAQLILVGDGEMRSEIENQIFRLELETSVSIIGYVEDVEKYLKKASVFALSSVREGLPLSILEAMAVGLPIVATDVGGVKDIVTNNGIVVESGNSIALSEAIIKILTDDNLRRSMSKRSLINVQKYNVKNICKQYEAIYLKYSYKKDYGDNHS